MAIFKALEFDGVNSLDYGIYITGEAVYNAPERAVEMINIPGKNGALALDQGRFENIEVTYHAGCFADSQADFADKVMRFRNALASRYTYKRLTDEYHPDEYRLGLYKSGLEVSAVRYGTAGQFTITFDCKPQRFLLDGDAELSPTEWSDLQTESGELVTIDSDGSLAVKSFEISLEPIQAGSGTPSPSNVRAISGRTEVVTRVAGKNLLPSGAVTETKQGVTFTAHSDGTITVNGKNTGSGTASFYIQGTGNTFALGVGSYILSGCPSGGGLSTYFMSFYYGNNGGNHWGKFDFGSGQTYTLTDSTNTGLGVRIGVAAGVTVNNLVFKPMLRLASDTDATYEPYQGTTYTTALGRTVYGGTLDVVSGVLTVDRASITLDGDVFSLSYNGQYTTGNTEVRFTPTPTKANGATNLIADRFRVVNYTSAQAEVGMARGNPTRDFIYFCVPSTVTSKAEAIAYFQANPTQVVYELATPQTYQLTPQQIDLLLGTNHLWSDGEITVEYGVHPYYNPTPFESKPLIKVTGTGTLGIGEYILTITGTASQTLYIDCETMEIYTLEGTVPTGASSLVSINKNDFPVLEPGTNYISVGSGITAVTITPRWWRI